MMMVAPVSEHELLGFEVKTHNLKQQPARRNNNPLPKLPQPLFLGNPHSNSELDEAGF